MNRDDWQRLKNLSLFKLWVTDRELRRYWPVAVLIAAFALLLVVLRLFTER